MAQTSIIVVEITCPCGNKIVLNYNNKCAIDWEIFDPWPCNVCINNYLLLGG